MVELMTTAYCLQTPKYLSVFLRSMICSVGVLAAANSEPYVAVSTAACLFKTSLLGWR